MSPVAGGISTASARHLTTLLVAAILVTLVWQHWTVRRSLDLVTSERVRSRALRDSLRSGTLLEPRLRDLERRLAELEASMSFAAEAVRAPEVIALRDWSRRLDGRVEANRRRIVRNERHIDSLWSAGPSQEIWAEPEARN